jgi:hypothetical protein
MSERISELKRILEEVKDIDEISKTTRKHFWKLVRQIKRERIPDYDEIKIATKIRNILFAERTANVYSLELYIGVSLVLGILSASIYIYTSYISVSWYNIFIWSIFEIAIITIRFFALFSAIAFFYPFGRLIAGAANGIWFDGMYFSPHKEPALKIEYESFLMTTPPHRKWFFFFSGLWTFLTALSLGIIGLMVGGDILGIAICGLFLCFYGFVLGSGSPSNSRGEMGHYNREKRIEAAWKKSENRD